MNLADGISIGSILIRIIGVTGVLLTLEGVSIYIDRKQSLKKSNIIITE